ncbi:Protein of unknown function (DUF2637) [Frankia torreyi]|uniref:DUF2637 domain-containing protein n=2 Tax=Frankia TaxID=1854 RepID=A0A0D8B5N3_9ACTN|nr:DUF2637 domain-containing protein [Frankia torreyi]KJE19410.1 Protein of unknown function (DUF2637) [Frankia torreyi]
MDGDQPVSEGRSSGLRAERAIRVTTVVAVATVAVVAAFVSYRHMRGVAIAHGEDSMTAAVLPFSVDGLIVAASMAMLADRRAGRNRSWLAYLLLALGACASLAANVLHAEPTVTARIIAGWPPLALLGSYELLMRQIHPAGRRTVGDPVTTVLPIPPQRGPMPAVTEPTITKPTVTKPTVTKPTVTKPTVTKPTVTKPTVTTAAVTEPALTTAAVTASTVTADEATTAAPSPAPAPDVADHPSRTDSRGPSPQEDDDTDRAGADRAGVDRVEADRPDAASPAGLDGAADPAAKREAIARTLDQTGGSVTKTVAVLAAQGMTVSRSWVYQVRRNTSYADVNTVPPTRPAHRHTIRGRRRGMAPERTLVPHSSQ